MSWRWEDWGDEGIAANATLFKCTWCRSKLNCTKRDSESTSSKSSSTVCGIFLFYCVPKTRGFYRNWRMSIRPSRRISVPAAEAISAATFYLRGICSSRISRPGGYSFWENWFSGLLSCQRPLCYAGSSCEGSNRAVSEKRNFINVNCSRLAGEDAGLLFSPDTRRINSPQNRSRGTGSLAQKQKKTTTFYFQNKIKTQLNSDTHFFQKRSQPTNNMLEWITSILSILLEIT